MSLRQQLLLVSLLLLSLPWAGCQFLREMESALQYGQEQALQATAQAVATVLTDRPELLYPHPARRQTPVAGASAPASDSLYASASQSPIIVDGYGDGWEGPAHASFGPVSYRARTRNGRLYLLLEVSDTEVLYNDPQRRNGINGDRLLLRTDRDYIIATAAPGPVQARFLLGSRESNQAMGSWEPAIRGFWQDSLEGYSVELEMPLSLTRGRLGLQVVQAGRDQTENRYGNLIAARPAPWLIYPPRDLQNIVMPFSRGLKLSVIDRDNWILAQAGDPGRRSSGASTPWLLRLFYRTLLAEAPPLQATAAKFGSRSGMQLQRALAGETAAGHFQLDFGSNQKLALAAVPIVDRGEVIGAVLAEQNSEQYLSLTDQAFSQLLLISLVAMAISALGLLGYASWLSWRIRQLSAASANAIGEDGRIRREFPASSAPDELGDLSRQHAQLLGKLRESTDYLRTLSRKLSHELRTPIAVIQSSLDNLEQNSADSEIYLERARGGLGRLSQMLTAMAEANRLEESLAGNVTETTDLAALCRELHAAYQQIYPDHLISLSGAQEPLRLQAAAELVAQAMDKLLDNAVGFSPAGGEIRISVSNEGSHAVIAVRNRGPLLPDEMAHHLFDSMVSIRAGSDDVHLGLGLHIVSLIMDFHAGKAHAENLEDGSGVEISLHFKA